MKGHNTLLLFMMCFLTGSFGSTLAKAQGVISTPITRLGYGVLENSSPVAWEGMGGVGIGMNSNKVINLVNPAGYAATDSLSFLMDVGASVNMGHYKDGVNKKTTFLGGLDYVAVQFPVYKDRVALSAGIVPFSHAGYGLVTDVEIAGEGTNNTMQQNFRGNGSLQSVYGGIGVRLGADFYMGANVRYLFGKLTHIVHTVPNSTILSQTYSQYTLRMSDFGLDLGAQYRFDLPSESEDNILVGVTYSPQLKVKPELSFVENSNYGSADRPRITDGSMVAESAMPHKIGVGLSWNRPGNIIVAADFSTQLWSQVPNIFAQDNLTLKDTYSAAIGMEIQPDRYSRRFSDRIYYRFGVNYDSYYYEASPIGHAQKVGASVGVGLPISSVTTDRSSLVNISLGYDRTFSATNSSMSQDILKLTLGFTFNETWFRKLKIY